MSFKKIAKDLEADLLKELEVEDGKRKYSWINDAEGISWSKFSESFPKHKLWLFTLLDISPKETRGWQQLALNFGLKSEEIMWCEKYCGPSGPTSLMFSKLNQKRTVPSLHHLLHHFLSLDRHDLLSRIPWQSCIDQMRESIVKERVTDSVPLNNLQTQQNANNITNNNHLKVSTNSPKKSKAYSCSVLMLYTSDTKEFAMKVCNQLRSQGPPNRDRKRIGVLLLSEQRHMLLADPSSTLYKWFMQVDYIVPVLSPELLRDFNSWDYISADIENSSGQQDSDALLPLHHRYIYRLALDQYVANYSRNIKCRPICPALFKTQIVSNEDVLNQGLLQIVSVCDDYRECDDDDVVINDTVENFAKLLIDSPRIG